MIALGFTSPDANEAVCRDMASRLAGEITLCEIKATNGKTMADEDSINATKHKQEGEMISKEQSSPKRLNGMRSAGASCRQILISGFELIGRIIFHRIILSVILHLTFICSMRYPIGCKFLSPPPLTAETSFDSAG
jgi:hypothetical protein